MPKIDEADESAKEQKPAEHDAATSRAVTGDLEVSDDRLDGVRGGKTPAPGGPVPIPYPN